MLTSGDILEIDLGFPTGSEAGFKRPAVLVTAQPILKFNLSVLQVIPLTSKIRKHSLEVYIGKEFTGLNFDSAAQCQHLRSISRQRVIGVLGNVGKVNLEIIRHKISLLLDIES